MWVSRTERQLALPGESDMLIENDDQYDPVHLREYDRPAPARSVMVSYPYFFQVDSNHNPYMVGRAGTVDRGRALMEWSNVGRALGALIETHVLIPYIVQMHDLCFTANPSLAGLDRNGEPVAVLSRMRHMQRQAEVPFHREFYAREGVRVLEIPYPHLDTEYVWEGGGDSLWHPDRFFLWAGYGQRSEKRSHRIVAEALSVPMGLLRLVDERFYHLDTCLAMLDARTIAWVPGAFDDAGRALLERAFPRRIEVDGDEAWTRLAGNLYCPNRRDVLLPAGSPITRGRLEAAGFSVQELVTDEFLKAGGSVFCLKQEIPWEAETWAVEGGMPPAENVDGDEQEFPG